MDTIRVVVRKYVDSALNDDFKKEIQNFSNRTNLGWYECGAYALNLDGVPTFRWLCDSCNKELRTNFTGLDNLYQIFYYKADIKSIWKRYKSTLDSLQYSYKPFSEKALSDITSFLKIDANYYSKYSGKIHLIICPLMSHWTAFNHTVGKTLYLVHGPTNGPAGPDIFYHEALHIPIGPIVEKYKSYENNIDTLFKLSQEQLKGNYNSIGAVLNESFVRTIDKYLSGKFYNQEEDITRHSIENEYKLGFIFCLYIYENLPEYLKTQKSFEEYYPILMSNLDIKKEIERWENFKRMNPK
jgi:hypothetical protein